MFLQLKSGFKKYLRITFSFLLLAATQQPVLAQDSNAGPVKTLLNNPLALTMLFIIVTLLLVISVLASVVGSSMEVFRERMKKMGTDNTVKIFLVVMMSVSVNAVFAQAETSSPAGSTDIAGISQTTFYFMAAVIAIELLVIFALLYNLRILIGLERKKKVVVAVEGVAVKPKLSLWERLNRFRPVEQEANIDLGHDYDGIRELDNRLPPWWLYGFYLTIIFAVVYLWRFHVSHTGPSSEMEFNIAMLKAERQKQEFLKKSAGNIDESSVKYLTAESDIGAGKNVFLTQCAACHGKAGEGGVGPNLTDDYWLHGGSINDIFKTIKYGVPEKGMRKWSDDFSPMQMAQIASFVKSIHGTNPPNGKEKQGNLYTEGAEPAASPEVKDSTATASN